jgi:uncharacterized protein (TIGR02757 family)
MTQLAKYKQLISQYEDMQYFTTDPIAVVKLLYTPQDIEIMAVVASWLAYGNRNQIFKKCNMALDTMQHAPLEYLKSGKWQEFKNSTQNFYRLFTYHDFYSLLNCLHSIYAQHSTLEEAILHHLQLNPEADYLDALIALLPTKGIPKDKSSACKRLCLMLRWLVRQDSKVDIGIWHSFDQTKLLIPLDTHVWRIAHTEGLISRSNADMKSVIELTQKCRSLFPHDPASMDFALFGIGFFNR